MTLEWCSDLFGRTYTDEPQINPQGIETAIPYPITRGGSWAWDMWMCRVSTRTSWPPGIPGRIDGFRVVLPAD